MSERTERLRATLQELETELTGLDSLDDTTRSELETLMGEIAHALGRTPPANTESDHLAEAESRAENGDGGPESLASRLQEAAEDFETSHPNLFGIVSRTIDALGQMGI